MSRLVPTLPNSLLSKAVTAFTAAHVGAGKSTNLVSILQSRLELDAKYCAVRDPHRAIFVLCPTGREHADTPAVFDIVGVLDSCRLPPDTHDNNGSNAIDEMDYGLKIVGAGSDVFEKGVLSAYNTLVGFFREICESALGKSSEDRVYCPQNGRNHCYPASILFEGIYVFSRYFVAAPWGSEESHAGFSSGEDPDGVLEHLAQTHSLRRLPRYKTTYYDGRIGGERPASPALFREGDTVRISVAFEAQSTHGHWVVWPRLQSITLLASVLDSK